MNISDLGQKWTLGRFLLIYPHNCLTAGTAGVKILLQM